MKFTIAKDSTPTEQETEVRLTVDSDGDLLLQARKPNAYDWYNILFIEKSTGTIKRCSHVSTDLGMKVNSLGQVEVSE